MTELSDHELLARFSSGKEESAFRALVDRHLSAVWAVAQSRTGDPEAARDLAQEAFVLLARQAARIRVESVVSGWLFLTVRNLASKWLRSTARRHQRELVYVTDPAMQSSPDSSDSAVLKRILVPALDELPAGERDMLLSRFFENRTCREIAGGIGSTEEAVRKKSARALDKLRLILARRGFASSAAALAAAMTTFAATAPPAGLAQVITAASIAAASGTAVLTGVSALLAALKTAKALTTAGAVAVTAAVGTTAWLASKHADDSAAGQSRIDQPQPGDSAPRLPGTGRTAGHPPANQAPRTSSGEFSEEQLKGAEGMAQALFSIHAQMGAGMPPEKIQERSLQDARKSMKPLKAFLPLSEESAATMERILTEDAANGFKEVYFFDHDMVAFLKANRSQFVEALAVLLPTDNSKANVTKEELDQRAQAWVPGVKEATVKYLKSYKALSLRTNNVMDERDWTEKEPTLTAMRAALPEEQTAEFDQFVTERQTIVREGRALTRSQQLAEALQLNAGQRQAVFEELLKSNKEDTPAVEALLDETQRAVYRK